MMNYVSDVTDQVSNYSAPSTSQNPLDVDDGVHPSSCSGGWGACDSANESMTFPSNFTDLDLDSDLGLNYVTAAATNYTLSQMIILGVLAGSTSLVTISGNLVVILSFIIERSIRQPSNYFIASLAVSDLLIGSVSMPFYTVYLLSGKYWPLGAVLCDLWLSLDYTVCLSSIYTVFCITIDRFCSVKIPAKYRNWRTERKVLTVICITWVIPVLVFFTSIIGWQYFVGKRTVEAGMCYVQYMEDAIFNVLLQIGYFWITLTVMCLLYAGIYSVALRLQRQSEAKHQRRTALLVSAAGGTMSRIGIEMSQQQQQQGTAPAATIDRNNSIQHQNGSNAVGSGGGEQHMEQCNNVVDSVPQPAAAMSPKSTKKGYERKRSKKNQRRQKDNKNHDEHESSSFAFTSDSDQEDFKQTSKCRQSKRMSGVVAATPDQRPKASGKASKKTKRRATRHTSPVVAVERAVQFIAEQSRTVDDEIHRPEMGTSTPVPSNTDCISVRPCTDQLYGSFDAVTGDCNFSSEALASKCRLDHQCVFEAWKRPVPRLSPVWVRRHDGELSRQRSDNNQFGSGGCVAEDHVFVDLEDNDGRTTCGCNLPSTFSRLSCLSTCFPERGSSDRTDRPCSTSTTAKTTLTTVRRTDGDQLQRRPSVARRSTTKQHCKPFVVVAALRRLPNPRRWRRARGDVGQAGPSTTAVQRGKNENRARKSLRTITIILGAFVLCWTPWHVLSMIMGFCPPCVEPVIYDISYWLCYLNSPINPFCYAFANQQFKKTFLRIFRFDWHRT